MESSFSSTLPIPGTELLDTHNDPSDNAYPNNDETDHTDDIFEKDIFEKDIFEKDITENENELVVPRIIFVVPYRDREQHRLFFARHMAYVMEDYDPQEYVIWYIHQHDNRGFNRGALKNIGVLIAKQKYPNDWASITFVFNDVDTMPFTKNFLDYETTPGKVKHFYGFTFALGGIVSITGGDFARINGFPNFWAWGYEDNLLQDRAVAANMEVDRTQFYPIMDKNILQFQDGVKRSMNRTEYDKFLGKTTEGLNGIRNLSWSEDNTDPGYENDIGMIDVTWFDTETVHTGTNADYDMLAPKNPFIDHTSISAHQAMRRRFSEMMRFGK